MVTAKELKAKLVKELKKKGIIYREKVLNKFVTALKKDDRSYGDFTHSDWVIEGINSKSNNIDFYCPYCSNTLVKTGWYKAAFRALWGTKKYFACLVCDRYFVLKDKKDYKDFSSEEIDEPKFELGGEK